MKMKYFYYLLLAATLLQSCTNAKKREVAREKSDFLLNEIADGSASNELSGLYSAHAIEVLKKTMTVDCDFRNRKGKYINDWYEANAGDIDRVSFIYEFYLKCYTMRIITTYSLGDEIKLSKLKIQKISEANPMIIDKLKELKY